MKRFFFDLVDFKTVVPDPTGTELDDIRAARGMAVRLATRLMAEGAENGEDRAGWIVQVKDGPDRIVFSLRFEEIGREGIEFGTRPLRVTTGKRRGASS